MNPSATLRSLSRASQQTLRAPFGLQQQRTWAAPSALLRKPHTNTSAPLNNNIRIRLHSTESSSSNNGTRAPRPLTDRGSIDPTRVKSDKEAIAERKAQQPCYDMTFTCKKCLERSSHRITKQAYHFGTVLVNCPGCKSRHLIADHMKIFSDTSITIEDIMREKGEFIKKGSLGADGDVEFYDDQAGAEEQQEPKKLP